jgi:hypothetical protein
MAEIEPVDDADTGLAALLPEQPVLALHREAISQGEREGGGQRSPEPRWRHRCLPRGRQVLLVDERQIEGMDTFRGAPGFSRPYAFIPK